MTLILIYTKFNVNWLRHIGSITFFLSPVEICAPALITYVRPYSIPCNILEKMNKISIADLQTMSSSPKLFMG